MYILAEHITACCDSCDGDHSKERDLLRVDLLDCVSPGVNLPLLMRENLCQLCEHEDCQDTSSKIQYQDHRPFSQEIRDCRAFVGKVIHKSQCVFRGKIHGKFEDLKR